MKETFTNRSQTPIFQRTLNKPKRTLFFGHFESTIYPSTILVNTTVAMRDDILFTSVPKMVKQKWENFLQERRMVWEGKSHPLS